MAADWRNDNVRVLVRNDAAGRLPLELLALFSFSISRALDTLEETPSFKVRLAVTHRIIDPLERARSVVIRAIRRPGSRERFILPLAVVELIDTQFRALCAASTQPGFRRRDLPQPLAELNTVYARFRTATGLSPIEIPTGTCPLASGIPPSAC